VVPLPARDYGVKVSGRPSGLRIEDGPDGSFYISVEGRRHVVKVVEGPEEGEMTLVVDGREYKVRIREIGPQALEVDVGGRFFRVELEPLSRRPARAIGRAGGGPVQPGPGRPRPTPRPIRGAILSPMPGRVVSLKVGAGEAVKKGDVLLIIEAMKMENEIRAPRDGVVREVLVSEGSSVSTGQPLLVLD